MTHVAMQQVDDQGSAVIWGQHVTDEEYNAAPASYPPLIRAGGGSVGARPASSRTVYRLDLGGSSEMMVHNEIDMDVPPERVFSVLSDPRSFARWVVGSREIRRADPNWPAIGTAFDHKVGVWPITLSDHSEVVESAPPHLLRLLVKARPFSKAFVTLSLRPVARGTRVEMDEGAADARSLLLFNPLTDPLIRIRNRESLRRLKALAEGKEPIPGGDLPPRDRDREAHITGRSGPAAT